MGEPVAPPVVPPKLTVAEPKLTMAEPDTFRDALDTESETRPDVSKPVNESVTHPDAKASTPSNKELLEKIVELEKKLSVTTTQNEAALRKKVKKVASNYQKKCKELVQSEKDNNIVLTHKYKELRTKYETVVASYKKTVDEANRELEPLASWLKPYGHLLGRYFGRDDSGTSKGMWLFSSNRKKSDKAVYKVSEIHWHLKKEKGGGSAESKT